MTATDDKMTVNITTSLPNTRHLWTYERFTFTITPGIPSPYLNRIKIEFPMQYQWVDVNCSVSSGL